MRPAWLLLLAIAASSGAQTSAHPHAPNKKPVPKAFVPTIPRVWDEHAIEELELPRASPVTVHHLPAAYYYSIPERQIWKNYPVYAPGREPKGYWEWLQKQEPAQAVNWDTLKTKADWIKAGSIVFDSANSYSDPYKGFAPVRDPDWYKAVQPPLTPEGILPFYRYVIQTKGKVEVATDSCAECHTRVMPNGKLIRGAQGNLAFGRVFAYAFRNGPRNRPANPISDVFYSVPWMNPDPAQPMDSASFGEFHDQLASLPPGINPRQGTSAAYPIQIPDLIGVKDHHYLDRTGLEQHRSILDLMRYDALQNFIQELTSYNGYIPNNDPGDTKLPDPKTQSRDSDRSLYAVALYLYSLKPPPNPNHSNAFTAKGQKIFTQQGCPRCHTPPLYTNNTLTPALGFKVSDDATKAYRITPVVVGTDPFNALNTRRGTGFYKVPSLKGVWYRGPFEHNGSVATLEDWFDLHRLDDTYVPTGYPGYKTKTRSIQGHEFGLDLSPSDKRALIAFLKTL